jgi:hypothetical protein
MSTLGGHRKIVAERQARRLANSGAVPVARRSGKRTGHGTFEEISARKTIKKPGVGAPGFLEFLGKPLAEGVRGVVR